jgi:hypothetical protein
MIALYFVTFVVFVLIIAVMAAVTRASGRDCVPGCTPEGHCACGRRSSHVACDGRLTET